MAKSLGLWLCFLVLFHCCLAQRQQSSEQNECNLSRLNAQKPSKRIQSEAGVTEIWDYKDQQFQCAGVAFVRYTIEPRGLLLPSYSNAPQLMYFIQGRGLQGVMNSGCPETFQSWEETERGEQEQGQQEEGGQEKQQQGQRLRGDQHQIVSEVEQGDAFAVTTGSAHWIYNNGNKKLIIVVVLDPSDEENQLDVQPLRFYLAGNPQNEFQQQQEKGQEGQQQQEEERGSEGRQQESSGNNIFSGFRAEQLAEAFNVDAEIIKKLQGQSDKRGNIVNVEGGLHALLPPGGQREERRQENRFEETKCSMRLKQNIGDPMRADIYTRGGGHLSSVTGADLPVLRRFIRMSAEKGKLQQGAVLLPRYNVNAHTIVYAIRGSADIQVVQSQGRTVFNEQLRQDQVLVLPQNFGVMIKASESEFEWVAFKTHEDPKVNTLAGRVSLMGALPVQAVSSAYQLSKSQAKQLKYSRWETAIASANSASEHRVSA